MPQSASEQVLATIMKETEQLDADRQLRLTAYWIERVRSSGSVREPQRRWCDLRGLYTAPALGEDAQEWVSRTHSEVEHANRHSTYCTSNQRRSTNRAHKMHRCLTYQRPESTVNRFC